MKRVLALDVKYSLIQALFFGSYCGLLGYASVYLLSKGFSNSIIGTTLALTSVLGVLAQPAVASYADKNKHIELRYLICFFILLSVLFGLIVYFLPNASILLLCLFVGVATCMTTLQTLLNSLAFFFEKYGIEINFGLARGMGSAAYALVSFALGYMVEDFGASMIPLVYIIGNLLMMIVVYGFVVPKNQSRVETDEVSEVVEQLSFGAFIVRYKKFSFFILGTILIFFAHTVINNFFIQVITPIGGSESDMGTAVFIAAIVELPAMFMFNTIRRRIKINTLIRFSALMFVVKYIITALATNVFMIYVAQFTQMFAYAILTPACVYYVQDIIEKKDTIKGQSMVTIGVTASGIIANFAGGVLLDTMSVSGVLWIGVVVSIIGAILMNITLETKKGDLC